MPRGRKKTEPSLLLPDELAAIAEKHRKALAPLADREAKLEAELATVRARRLAVEECLLPIERVIADQRVRAEAKSVAEASAFAADDVPAPTLVDSYLGAEGEPAPVPVSTPLPPWRAGA